MEHCASIYSLAKCSICLELFRDPVTTDCGHSFCSGCITQHWDRGSFSCPECRQSFTNRPQLAKNIRLSQISEALQQEGSSCDASARAVCQGQHQNLLSYCQTERVTFCSRCENQDHQTHRTVTLEQELTRAQELITKHQKSVVLQLERTLEEISACEERTASNQASLQRIRVEVEKEFARLLMLVKRAGSEVGEFLVRVESEMVTGSETLMKQLKDHVDQLRQEQQELQMLLTNHDQLSMLQGSQTLKVGLDSRFAPAAQLEVLENLNKLTPATRVLSQQLEKQLEAFTQRHLTVSTPTGQQHTEPQSPESRSPLQNVPVSQSSPLAASSQDAERLTVTPPRNIQQRHCEPQTREELKQYLRKVTFDLNTASPMVQLSDDRRCAFNSHPKVQKYPRHEARFLHFDQVLAEQLFSDGRHYWEISVTGSPIRIGISSRQIVRNSRGAASLLGGNQFSWCLELAEGKRTVWHSNESGELLPCPYQCLGIYLNIPEQTLIFYGISKGTADPLHHESASFTLPLLPAFQISRGARIRIEV